MHRRTTAAAVALLLTWGCLAETARAQEPATPAVIPRARPGLFLGLDVFGGAARCERNGVVPSEDPDKEHQLEKLGWDAGATVSVGVRWLGITGALGRQTTETLPTYHMVVGPRVTSPWAVSDEGAVRVFAHALVGFASTSGVTPSQSSAEWVIGGGVDILLLRIQVDNVWLKLNGVKTSNLRVFFGGVVPLCLRGCRESDGFNVSGRPTWK